MSELNEEFDLLERAVKAKDRRLRAAVAHIHITHVPRKASFSPEDDASQNIMDEVMNA